MPRINARDWFSAGIPVQITGLMSPGSETEKGAEVCRLLEPSCIIKHSDAGQGDHRTNAPNCHKATRKVTFTRNTSQLIIHGFGCRAECLVDWIEHLHHQLDCWIWIGRSRLGKLISEALPLSHAMHGTHTDAKDLQRIANMCLQILAHPDQTFSCADQHADALCGLASNMDLAEPTGAREMGQAFCVTNVGFVDTP